MYTNQLCHVKWGGEKSASFPISNGVKQGGVISPLLFSLYVDELFLLLKTNDDPLINEDSYDHSELGNADADCNFLVNNRRTICAYYNERFLMSHINTQTHSHYYKKNKHNY